MNEQIPQEIAAQLREFKPSDVLAAVEFCPRLVVTKGENWIAGVLAKGATRSKRFDCTSSDSVLELFVYVRECLELSDEETVAVLRPPQPWEVRLRKGRDRGGKIVYTAGVYSLKERNWLYCGKTSKVFEAEVFDTADDAMYAATLLQSVEQENWERGGITWE